MTADDRGVAIHVEPVRLANGRLVTAGTAWWVEHTSGSPLLRPGVWLACVHNVRLAHPCPECKATA